MKAQVTLEIADVLDSIKLNAKEGYVTQEVLERICFGNTGRIKSLVDNGFLINRGNGMYPLTRKLLNYDAIQQITPPKDYDDLAAQQWGKLSSFI